MLTHKVTTYQRSNKLDASPIDFSTRYWINFDDVVAETFQGWVFFESNDVFVKRRLFCFPLLYNYDRIHVVCYNGVIKFGRSLSQSSVGLYDYAMNLMDAKIYLLPVCLQIKFKDKNRQYIIMMERLEDYKFMIRTIKVQKQEKYKDKELFLFNKIKNLHREHAKYMAQEKNMPCEVIYKYLLEETNQMREINRTSGHFFRLRCLAKRRNHLDMLGYYILCWC